MLEANLAANHPAARRIEAISCIVCASAQNNTASRGKIKLGVQFSLLMST